MSKPAPVQQTRPGAADAFAAVNGTAGTLHVRQFDELAATLSRTRDDERSESDRA